MLNLRFFTSLILTMMHLWIMLYTYWMPLESFGGLNPENHQYGSYLEQPPTSTAVQLNGQSGPSLQDMVHLPSIASILPGVGLQGCVGHVKNLSHWETDLCINTNYAHIMKT